MKILLICDTAIIEHIFILVCKRIKVDLIVQKTTSVDKKYDLIIVDQPFIDNKFNSPAFSCCQSDFLEIF